MWWIALEKFAETSRNFCGIRRIFRTFLPGPRNPAGAAGIFLRGLLTTAKGCVCVQEFEFGAFGCVENCTTFGANYGARGPSQRKLDASACSTELGTCLKRIKPQCNRRAARAPLPKSPSFFEFPDETSKFPPKIRRFSHFSSASAKPRGRRRDLSSRAVDHLGGPCRPPGVRGRRAPVR